ncbi:CGH_1_collapsed_G0041390.mRNA.1.CDS.1 [Saccharomyces cerevisiae]|nr:CGH_1_collapsed_G0041390.mRNA.1.CDS.1 [Saccharomyces cerevisiae]
MSPTGNYLNAITNRRTIYNLKPELPQGVGLDDVKRTVHVILKNTPTAFNSQVNRAVIIVGDTHKRIWDAVASAMPTAEAKKRPESCRDEAYGSVIFFTDEGPTEKLQRDFPALAAAFPNMRRSYDRCCANSVLDCPRTIGIGG